MLVLTREADESVRIGNDVVVTVVEIQEDAVRLGFEAPKYVSVHRQEVYESIKRGEGPPKGGRSVAGPLVVSLPAFECTDRNRARVFHDIPIDVDREERLVVIGADGCGSYEWVLFRGHEVVSHSDDGYGCDVSALRDGLMAAMPPVEETAGPLPARVSGPFSVSAGKGPL